MKLKDATNEREFIEAVRSVFRAYVPESDAWAKPNFFDINATVIGGFLWSSVNEIRNGIDKRLNPQTAVGEHLDVLVSQPPLNMTRRGATKALGAVEVNLTIDDVPKGYVFETASGGKYQAISDTTLKDGKGVVEVESVASGAIANSDENQPMTAKDGEAVSMGVYGGFDVECDEQLRRRLYAAKARFTFFGSQCSMQDAIAAFPGVTRSWVIQDGLAVKIMVLMEDKYPCGVPQKSDFDAMADYFNDECLANMYFCPVFDAPRVIKIAPDIIWSNGMPDTCDVSLAMQDWLRENYGLGDGVRAIEIQAFLSENFGEFDPKLTCCDDYPPFCDAVYNCVEIIGCGGVND